MSDIPSITEVEKMEDINPNNVQIVIKTVSNDGIIIRDTKQLTDKGEEIKTTEYFLEVDEEGTDTVDGHENTEYITIENDDESEEGQFVAVDVSNNGELILQDKDVILIDELCRICADESDRFIPIFTGEGLEHNLSNKIHSYLPLKVSENDNLPLQICYNCAATLLAWHEMYRGCLNAQERLENLQTKFNLKGQDQYYNNSIIEDENNDNVLEVKNTNSEEIQDEIKDEQNIETMQIVNIADSDRSKNPQRTCVSFKEFQKTYKPTIESIKSRKKPQAASKPLRKRTRRTIKKSPGKASLKDVKLEVESHNVIPKQETEELIIPDFKVESISVDNDTESEDFIESLPSPAESIKVKKPRKRHATEALQCNLCNKKFRLHNSYQIHMRLHTGEKPYACHTCDKQFGQTGSLYYHLKHVHGGVKNHACDICGRCFAMKTAMQDHRRIHTGERPYVCDSCGKTFKTKASLYIHGKIHTNDYPFKCSYCKKLFRWKQQMISHETTHTGEKNHICDICGKGFGVKNELTRHRRTHSSDKPFTCQKCGVSFGQKRYLTNHNRTRHKAKATGNS